MNAQSGLSFFLNIRDPGRSLVHRMLEWTDVGPILVVQEGSAPELINSGFFTVWAASAMVLIVSCSMGLSRPRAAWRRRR